jgi:hypothetical protein
MEVLDNDADVLNFFMSVKAHFHLNENINKQNFHYWAEGYPKQLQEQFLYDHKIIIWCTVPIIEIKYFFKKTNQIITVNSD